MQIATWRLDAGAADAELLTRAAQTAGALFDHELAVRLASAALERGAGTPAAILLASAQTSRNRFAAAHDALAPWEGQDHLRDRGQGLHLPARAAAPMGA